MLDARRGSITRGRSLAAIRWAAEHGRSIEKLKVEDAEALTVYSEDVLRRALLKILSDATLVTRLAGDEREAFFENLVFGADATQHV